MIFKKLNLYTSNLEQQKDFYQHTLGLVITKEEKEHSFLVQVGTTEVSFHYKAEATPYHFAINIPSADAPQALAWLKERVQILKDGDNDITDFKSWNAESIYFYDPDNNIVELIARKNLEIPSHGTFNQDSFLNISEIGIAVPDLTFLHNTLKNICPIEIYDGSLDVFCAMGDENGMFIGVNIEKKTWFPSGDTPYSSEFGIELETHKKMVCLAFKNGEIWEV